MFSKTNKMKFSVLLLLYFVSIIVKHPDDGHKSDRKV